MVAEYQGHMIGCMIYRPLREFWNHGYYIMTLGVIKEMRGLGIGEMFVEKLEG